MPLKEGYAVRKSPTFLRLHLGDYLIRTFGEGETGTVQTAVALLRTVFEDHYVDPEHQTCLFFHGCTLAGGSSRSHDFTVVHRRDRIILSDFSFRRDRPAYVSLSLNAYVSQVVRFGVQVLAGRVEPRTTGPEWQQRHLETQMSYLQELTQLGQRLLDARCNNYEAFCAEFQVLHGHLKRPLELQVLDVAQVGAPRQPVSVNCRVVFGPLGVHEVLPMRLNLGDVVLVSVEHFTNAGPVLTLEGVGSGGVRPGDRLLGMQLYYS